jgi:hypothetical protein
MAALYDENLKREGRGCFKSATKDAKEASPLLRSFDK